MPISPPIEVPTQSSLRRRNSASSRARRRRDARDQRGGVPQVGGEAVVGLILKPVAVATPDDVHDTTR